LSAEAYRVTGPTATAGDPRRFVHLTTMLAVTDWKLRFYGSALGYLWSLIRPLLLFGILLFVFSKIVRIGGGVPHYEVQLLIGVVLFSYFSEVTGDSVASVIDREQLVRKVSFPRMVVPLSVALAGSFNLGLNLLVVLGLILAVGIDPSLEWLLVPLVVVLLIVLTTGVGMLLSALYVPFRDVRPIWDVLAQGLFYATPVFYPIELVLGYSETLARIMMANPLATIIVEVRHLILGDEAPSAAEVIGGTGWLLVPLAVLVAATALGFLTFSRMAPRVAEAL
jgi:ABC-2 type transport system permease protein